MIYIPRYKLAFFHIMKCGGSSIVNWLKETDLEYKIIKNTSYHEPIADKEKVLGTDFKDIRIFSLIRNPFAKLVSFYTFYRQFPKDHSGDTEIAHNNTFKDFVMWYLQIANTDRLDGPYLPRKYLCIDNHVPANLNILRLENCLQEVPDFLRRYDIPLQYHMLYDNISTRDCSIASYYNDSLAKLVYQTHQWCFKVGNYKYDSWKSL